MNQDQITGILRALIPAVLAYVVGRGWLPETVVADVTAAALAIAAAVWSYVNNSTVSKATSVVKEDGEVEIVVHPTASAGMRELAIDPAVRNIVSATSIVST